MVSGTLGADRNAALLLCSSSLRPPPAHLPSDTSYRKIASRLRAWDGNIEKKHYESVRDDYYNAYSIKSKFGCFVF